MDSPVTAKAAILAALIRGPSFGLDIIERVAKQTKGEIVLNQGSVYPALRDLEREGLLESYDGEATPDRGGRPRRYYRLTAEGAKAATSYGEALVGLFDFILGGARA